MKALSATLRSQLERTVIAARDAAEAGAAAALERLAVDKPEAFSHMTASERELRKKLRARGRQLGDEREKNGGQGIWHLHRECAYEVWHQMLFARFLAENHLLMHPDGVPVTLEECDELAKEQGTDGWTLAARYASQMLPQIFRPEDPLLQITLAPEDKQALEGLLAALPQEVFTADDSLGWVYQFWQGREKDSVNASGETIGADELPAVTQLFTEEYMVLFLLHNTIGAWRAGKVLAEEMGKGQDRSEDDWRAKVAVPGYDFDYLRFLPDGRPAAGTFSGWPKRAADLKILDPCCGSGHFLVAAFDIMVRIRKEEDGLSPGDACAAVLRDNLHGLEIDERCCQIAAFALALAAWKHPEAGGYRSLPDIRVACTGIGPQATEEQWLKLAEQSRIPTHKGGEESIRNGLANLHKLFSQAPTLGSLIAPSQLSADLIAVDYETLRPHLSASLIAEQVDEDAREQAVAAAGMVLAADLLANDYHLVITNVPYLGRRRQDDALRNFCHARCADGETDLATVFVDRCFDFSRVGGSFALVTPQNWLFMGTYEKFRKRFLKAAEWGVVARLGPHAFETITGEVVNVCLIVLTRQKPAPGHVFVGVEVAEEQTPTDKAKSLRAKQIHVVTQEGQLANPDARITFEEHGRGELLSTFGFSPNGLHGGDSQRFRICFWELAMVPEWWRPLQGTVDETTFFGGREALFYWPENGGLHRNNPRARIQGDEAWGRSGVVVSLMSHLPATLYSGEMFDMSCSPIVPRDPTDLPAIWAFCSSSEFNSEVRKVDQALKVTNATIVKIPFDRSKWKRVADELFPEGLPKPYSDDATQWLFHGRPEASPSPLHVAVARLLGYRWPAELDAKMSLSIRARDLVKSCDELLRFADVDGVVCIPAVAGEEPASDRLLALLSACGIKPDHDLDDWLRDRFFEEHCRIFQQRPFIWQIWDGRKKDGFNALVNYHKLDRKGLEKLIYTYLGDWIGRQKAAEQRGESGSEARRLAAENLQERLKKILEGEKPYDIFVRWKPLEEQAIGWEPDLNDGVRMNIRPFVEAGVVRKNPNIKWTKDRGKEPERDRHQYPWFWDGSTFTGDRLNDVHLTLAEKRAAREARPGQKKSPIQQTLPVEPEPVEQLQATSVERDKYEQYVSMVRKARIEPKSLQDWLKNYREMQSRQKGDRG